MLRLGGHDANAGYGEIRFEYVRERRTLQDFRGRLRYGLDTAGARACAAWSHPRFDLASEPAGRRRDCQRLGHRRLGVAAGRFTPWVRYGYANHSDDGPTPVKHMANVGLVINEIFGQSYDRIGLGYTWSDPANHELDDQSTIDTYYRVQVTPELQFGPTFQVISTLHATRKKIRCISGEFARGLLYRIYF